MRPLASLLGVATVTVTAVGVSTAAGNVAGGPEDGEVAIQILGINDFHGHLEPPAGKDGHVGPVVAGGAEHLATHIDRMERTNPNSIVVSAGDLFGNSPLLSALFHDEPTVEAMNDIGLDLNAVGNHELDEGADELRRMQDGGCHPTDGCGDGTGFGGSDFAFLAANTMAASGPHRGRTLFAPYAIERFDGVDLAFVGLTLEGTPFWTGTAPVAGWEFHDEADTVNALVPELRQRGVEAVVVLLHEGGQPQSLDVDGCAGVSGPVVDIVERMDDEVDLVLSGHTHDAYNCVIDGTPVTSAYSYGRIVTDVDVRVDRRSGEVTTMAIDNRLVTRDVPADPGITELIDRYRRAASR